MGDRRGAGVDASISEHGVAEDHAVAIAERHRRDDREMADVRTVLAREILDAGLSIRDARAQLLPFWSSKPQNAGPNVNTTANETRASLSWDGTRLYVGRADVFVSQRR